MTLPSLLNLKVPSSFLLNTTNIVGVVVDRSLVLTMAGRSHFYKISSWYWLGLQLLLLCVYVGLVKAWVIPNERGPKEFCIHIYNF